MLTIKSSSLNLSVTAALGSAMMLATTMAMTADAQSGRVKARSDRGVAAAIKGPEGGLAARARGCNQVEGGQNCGSASGIIGANGAIAGRGSVSEIGEDGSFSRNAEAYGLSDFANGSRTLNSEYNPDGSGQRSVDGFVDAENGFAERNSLITLDENGNVIRAGAASGAGDLGAFSTEGGGTYSEENGLDYARESQGAAAGESGAVYADRESAYNQETGLAFTNNGGGSFSGENGSVQGQSNSSFTQEDGLVLDREANLSNAEGGTLDADLTYNAQEGADANVTCTNAAGEIVACRN